MSAARLRCRFLRAYRWQSTVEPTDRFDGVATIPQLSRLMRRLERRSPRRGRHTFPWLP